MKSFLALCLVMLTCSLFAGSSSVPPGLSSVDYAFVKSFDVGQIAAVQVPTGQNIIVSALAAVDLPFIIYELPSAEVPTLTVQNYSKPGTITALQQEREVLKLLIPDRPCLNCQYSTLKTVFDLSAISYNCPLPYS